MKFHARKGEKNEREGRGREGRWIYINENVPWDKAREGNQMPRRLVILLYFCFSNDFYLQCVDSPSLPSPLCEKIAFSPPSGIILYGGEWEFNAALPQKLANSRKTGKGRESERA